MSTSRISLSPSCEQRDDSFVVIPKVNGIRDTGM